MGKSLNTFFRVAHNEDGTLVTSAVRAAGAVHSTIITDLMVLTQAQYDGITPSPTVLYIVI